MSIDTDGDPGSESGGAVRSPAGHGGRAALIIVGSALIAGLVAVIVSRASTPAHILSGDIAVKHDYSMAGDHCTDDSGRTRSGLPVVVIEEIDFEEVGTATGVLREGTAMTSSGEVIGCSFAFSIEVDDVDNYGIRIGDDMPYYRTRAELDRQGWHVSYHLAA